MPNVRFLPAASRSYLFDIVVNRINADSQNFNENPSNQTALTKRKFASAAGLPAGGPGAGLNRLLRIEAAYGKTTWWWATHRGENSYRFDQIFFPVCGPCRGTSDSVCAICHGSGQMRSAANIIQKCNACNGIGYGKCATCCPPNVEHRPIILDGSSINPNYNAWT